MDLFSALRARLKEEELRECGDEEEEDLPSSDAYNEGHYFLLDDVAPEEVGFFLPVGGVRTGQPVLGAGALRFNWIGRIN